MLHCSAGWGVEAGFCKSWTMANLNMFHISMIAVERLWKCQAFTDPNWFPVAVSVQVRIHPFPTKISAQI